MDQLSAVTYIYGIAVTLGNFIDGIAAVILILTLWYMWSSSRGRDTFERRRLRAYVSVSLNKKDWINTLHTDETQTWVSIKFKVSNHGQTPAKNILIEHWAFWTLDAFRNDDPRRDQLFFSSSCPMIGPHEVDKDSFFLIWWYNTAKMDLRKNPNNGFKKSLELCARLTYQDSFGGNWKQDLTWAISWMTDDASVQGPLVWTPIAIPISKKDEEGGYPDDITIWKRIIYTLRGYP